MDQAIKSGIVVLSTGSGIHKISYKLEDSEKMVLTINLESPLLSNGHATFQTTINFEANVYRYLDMILPYKIKLFFFFGKNMFFFKGGVS